MPDDGVTSQDDAGSEPEEAPVPAEEPAGEVPESDAAALEVPSPDEASAAEEPQDNEPPGEPGPDEANPAPAASPRKLPDISAEAFAEQMLARHRSMDPQRNTVTRPPGGERVTFRSITLAEVYVGRQADALAETLRATEWVNVDEQFADEIAKARQGDAYYNSQFLLMPGPASNVIMNGYGKASMPTGVERIAGQLYVLGPSMVALVLTFVLADSEAGCLNKGLSDDAESEIRRSDSGMVGVKTVFQAKYERVQDLLDGLGGRCLDWLKAWASGTLGADDGLDVPLCSLISLAQGKPFETQGEYMRLLDLASGFSASKFARPDYIFLTPRTSRKRPREFVATFNETDASESYPDLSVAPEILHEAIFPFMVVLALEGILRLFESRMRGTRSDLAKLDFSKGMEPRVVGLRNHLLELSRDIAVVCGDIKGVIEDNTALSILADYPLLVPVDQNQPSPPPARSAAEARRKNIGEFIENLKRQEAELRELVLVTSQAVSDVQNAKTQKRLNWLTIALVFLTVALVFIGVVALFHSPSDSSNSPSGATRTGSPTPAHSLHLTPIPSPTVSAKGAPTATGAATMAPSPHG